MTVQPKRAAGHLEHEGETYYFCGLGCVRKYEADPDRFLHPETAPRLPRQNTPAPCTLR